MKRTRLDVVIKPGLQPREASALALHGSCAPPGRGEGGTCREALNAPGRLRVTMMMHVLLHPLVGEHFFSQGGCRLAAL